jgi:hypothetical protein
MNDFPHWNVDLGGMFDMVADYLTRCKCVSLGRALESTYFIAILQEL